VIIYVPSFTIVGTHTGQCSHWRVILRDAARILILAALTLIVGMLAACAPTPGETASPESAEATPEATAEDTTETTEPAPETDAQEEEAPTLDDACIACHTNQELLEGLATEEEDVAESLSSGEG
jgi:cytochrome c5